jgi:aryl-alcohol dehydrogenase-like predicted oxidoreductase
MVAVSRHFFMPACCPDRRERDEQDWRVVEVVTDIARGLGCSPAQVGLAWVMRQPAVATTIVGATTVEQLKVNLAASEIGLDADALQVLDTASRDHSDSLTGSAQTLHHNRRVTRSPAIAIPPESYR